MIKDVGDSSLRRLLDLQAEDTAIARLEHRRASLPEAQRLAELTEQVAELSSDIEIAHKQLDEIARDQSRIEGEIELLNQKIEREESRLFSGNVANPKELGALQAEVAMLKRKKAVLEDELLEVMVQKDDAASTLGSLQSEHQTATDEAQSLQVVVEGLLRAIDADLTTHGTSRTALAGEIPDDVLVLYDSLRATKGGVGAAALEAGTCQGCHTRLPSREVERLRAAEGIQRCDNCRRILVIL